ncbi:MAG: hypothetical protein CYPHOPRED_002796 [Cyphobasidiales sp. Tagirdzhanova-0007]|nr:MAG: hypothetical protein CYPHOPRED_002796 [Cyphobasidiales sp. Tagirdzhanova-0007]
MAAHHANGPSGHASAPSKAAQAGGKAFSSAARHDPALLPLGLIVGSAVCLAGYFFSSKWGTAGKPDKQFATVSNVWDGDGKGALYKYRYMNKQGKIETSGPATNYEVVPHSENIDRLKAFSIQHHTSDKA